MACQRIPFLLVAGTKEQEEGTIAIRSQDAEDPGVMELNAAANWILAKVEASDAQQRREALKQVHKRLEASRAKQPA